MGALQYAVVLHLHGIRVGDFLRAGKFRRLPEGSTRSAWHRQKGFVRSKRHPPRRPSAAPMAWLPLIRRRSEADRATAARYHAMNNVFFLDVPSRSLSQSFRRGSAVQAHGLSARRWKGHAGATRLGRFPLLQRRIVSDAGGANAPEAADSVERRSKRTLQPVVIH